MITSKATRCARFCWAYVTRYPHTQAREIPAGTYTREEIDRALSDLEAGGLIVLETIPRGYVALVPFVVELPWGR